jgi:Zn-dependent protease with chaperone function
MLLMILFLLIALTVFILGMGMQRSMLFWLATFFWLLTVVASYANSTIPWGDLQWYLAIFSVGMTFLSLFEANSMRKKDLQEDKDIEVAENKNEKMADDGLVQKEDGSYAPARISAVRRRAQFRRERVGGG